jgi:cytochrome c553
MNSIRLLAAGLALAALFAASAPGSAQEDLARGQQLFSLCAQCHGDAAQGNQNIGAPAIAGLPAWYVKAQLVKFSTGLRGKHFDDLEGMRMRPMSLWLVAPRDADGKHDVALGEANIAAVSAYVGSLAAAQPVPAVVGGNVAAGEASWPLCGSCHGLKGEGSEPQSSPPLAGQSDWYLLRSLQKYKAGARGYDGPNDPFGATMMGMANVLADEQAMKDVIAFVSTLPK